MSNKKYPDNNKITLSIFELVFLVWSGGILLSILLAILGIFYPVIVWLYLALNIFTIWNWQKKEKLIITKLKQSAKILLAVLIIWIGFLSAFVVPTIFGGRDEGSISTSALLINRDHGLNHQNKVVNTFGKIYGEGKALNFPGFFYQKNTNGNFDLKSQFLPGYSSYLANFAYANNLNLLKFANALPLLR